MVAQFSKYGNRFLGESIVSYILYSGLFRGIFWGAILEVWLDCAESKYRQMHSVQKETHIFHIGIKIY